MHFKKDWPKQHLCLLFLKLSQKKSSNKLVDPQKSAFMSHETKTLKKYGQLPQHWMLDSSPTYWGYEVWSLSGSALYSLFMILFTFCAESQNKESQRICAGSRAVLWIRLKIWTVFRIGIRIHEVNNWKKVSTDCHNTFFTSYFCYTDSLKICSKEYIFYNF